MDADEDKRGRAPLPQDRLPEPRGEPFRLLDGIRVLDLTTSIAGPYATMLLADYGAEVIKVERPGIGDDARHWGPPFLDGESLWFLAVNRNKQSLALDYARPEGHALLLDLVARADALILNQVPRLQAKLGTDYETLKAMKESGCRLMIVGYESGDPQILKNIKKGATVERARQFTKDAHKLGLKAVGHVPDEE